MSGTVGDRHCQEPTPQMSEQEGEWKTGELSVRRGGWQPRIQKRGPTVSRRAAPKDIAT